MLKKLLYLQISLFIFFASCVTHEVPIEEEYSIEQSLIDISTKNITNLIDEGFALKALQLILSVDETEPEYNDVNNLYDMAFSEMETEYKRAVENDDFLEAIKYKKSFIALNLEEIEPRISLNQLNYQYVTQMFEEKADAAAISYLYNTIEWHDLSLEQIKELEVFLIEAGNVGPLKKLYEYLLSQSENADPETINILSQDLTVQDIISGTVTVWVNRGIKIENGVGVPDRGIGSGFFIDKEGHILTNYHVISSEVDPEYEGYSRLFVKLSEHQDERIPAKVIGWDKEMDLALLKTEADPSYIFSLSEDFSPEPGDKIFAIGSPGGLNNTLTAGAVSSLNRQLQPLGDSLQVDVPINPGNSGGPLLNSSNEVLGVVFAGIEQFEGVNFAIPVSDVKEILPELYRGGKVEHPFLGAALYERPNSLEVLYVVPGSPAHQIGLQKGDVIQSINGQPFTKVTEIQRYLLTSEFEELIRINWLNSQGSWSAVASLDMRPELPLRTALSRDAFDNLMVPLFGMEVERITGRGNKNVTYSISDVLPGSTADESGISIGDTIQLRKWELLDEDDAIIIQIIMKTRKAGFIESAVQIGTFLAKGFFI